MNRNLIVLLSLFLLNPLMAQSSKKTIAVIDFVNAGGIDKNEISIMTDRFNNYLVNTEVFTVLEREKMEAILKEQNFKMSDNCTTAECEIQVGQLLGVQQIVAGKIGVFGNIYTIDVRVIDLTSGQIVKTKSENYGGKKEGLLDVIESLAYEIADKSAPAKGTTGFKTTDVNVGEVTIKYGSLEINNEITGTLYVDDKKIGHVTEGSVIPVDKLRIGQHSIKIDYSDNEFYGEFVQKVDIVFDQKTKLTAKKGPAISTFTDTRDGRVYNIVKIGTQVWMAENLDYATPSGSWCYGGNLSQCKKYGRLYDWSTARSVAPAGWHLPREAELAILFNALRGSRGRIVPGGASSFAVVLGGMRSDRGSFNGVQESAYFWTSSEVDADNAWYYEVKSGDYSSFMSDQFKYSGLSVRCIKD